MFISVSSSNQPCSTNKEDRSKSSSARQNLFLLSKQSRQCTQNISKPPLHLHTIQSRWSLIHAAFLTTGWSLQVVTRQPLGESPAPAPCRTALRCCACCTRRSSTRTASWPAGSRLFPTLLSASRNFLFQILHKTISAMQLCIPHLHLLWIGDRQETLYECIHSKDNVFPSSTRQFLQSASLCKIHQQIYPLLLLMDMDGWMETKAPS